MQQTHTQHNIDWSQVKEAYENERAKGRLKKSITPLVEEVADDYIDQTDADKQKLIEAGFSGFDKALQRYYERTKLRRKAGESTYSFWEYYRWWAKRGVKNEIGIAKNFSLSSRFIIRMRNFFRDIKTRFLLLFKD